MATSLLSPLSSPAKELVAPATALPKSSFLSNTNLFFSFTPSPSPSSSSSSSSRTRLRVRGCHYSPPSSKSLDHIPKQFRKENLKDGLMDNYKNVPQSLYGLTPSQIDMFMTEDNPVRRQSKTVTEESISSARNYMDNGGMYNLSRMKDFGTAKYTMSMTMSYGGADVSGRPDTAPPDLPSLLLDARICYLGMPIVPSVTELLIAQFMWLDFDDASRPIYLYINSTGTQDENKESVGSEAEAYAIADAIGYCKSDVYTINCGLAFGQAAMILSAGKKGHRAVQPNSLTKLYLPKVSRSSGPVTDMYIKAKELDVNCDYYIELLANYTGKTKEEISKDIQRPKFLMAQEAMDYGLADKILDSKDETFEKRDYDQILAQQDAMMRAAGGPQASPGILG